MSGSRLVYQNWIVELGGCPDQVRAEAGKAEQDISPGQLAREKERQEMIRNEVAEALSTLTDDEKEFIERFYYCGQTYGEISKRSGRAIHKLEAIHKRAVRKLKRRLQPLVARLYGCENARKESCLICDSPYRLQIDRLISNRRHSETWKKVIRTVRDEYGIRIGTPQTLIGHKKYH